MQVQLVVLLVCSILASVLVGKLSQKLWGHHRSLLTRKTQIICLGISGLVVAPLTTIIQYQTNHYNRLTFHEYYSGVETGTEALSTVCQERWDCASIPIPVTTIRSITRATIPERERITYHPEQELSRPDFSSCCLQTV